MNFTTFLAADREHWPELVVASRSWRRYFPAMWEQPLVIITDDCLPGNETLGVVALELQHPHLSVIPPLACGSTQRERMLASLAILPGRFCETPWFLKLDTDTVAAREVTWPLDEWDRSGVEIYASRWSYTKPASWLDRLNAWAVEQGLPGASLPVRREETRRGEVARSRRFTSYAMLCRTDVAVRFAGIVGDSLPVPSQDTSLWYLAERLGWLWRGVDMPSYGWKHCGSCLANVKRSVGDALGKK